MEQTTPLSAIKALELLAGVLAALARVMQQRIGLPAAPDRHDEGIFDELRCRLRLHGPAHHATRERADDGRYVKPTLGGPDIGEISDLVPVPPLGMELAVEHVGRDR